MVPNTYCFSRNGHCTLIEMKETVDAMDWGLEAWGTEIFIQTWRKVEMFYPARLNNKMAIESINLYNFLVG